MSILMTITLIFACAKYYKSMIHLILLTIVITAACVLLLGIRVFFTKKGKFPNTHVGGNPHFRKKGISCAKSQDLEDQNKKNIFELSELN